MSKVLFLANHDMGIYNFRLEIIERFLKNGHEVHVSTPYGERIEDLIKIGVKYHEIEMERHGTNPLHELRLLGRYKKLIKEISPDIIYGFTIKPNIYGAIVSRRLKIPFVANITGLGTAVENPGIKQKVFISLYKYAFRDIKRVFFQNEENKRFFVKHGIATDVHELIPGSGVNLKRFQLQQYPKDTVVKFAFISRIMKEKGIEQYLKAAEVICDKYENVEFHICGFCEPEYENELQKIIDKGIVIYHGLIRNVSEFMGDMHAIIHPTYYPEGMSNVLLEACAVGRPIITTDRSGCREIVEDGYNGYMIPQKDADALIKAVDKFIQLEWQLKEQMGINARKKVEDEFDREIVVQRYVDELESIGNR